MQLVLYHQVLADPAVAAMLRYRAAGTAETYLALVREVLACRPPRATGDLWQDHLIHRILYDANPFTRAAARGDCPRELVVAATFDLRQLQSLLTPALPPEPGLPRWPGYPQDASPWSAFARELAAAPDWGAMAPRLAEFHRRRGAGIFCAHWHLRWEEGELRGVADPDPVALDDLVGLEAAREAVVSNTRRLVRGLPANNLLLYGPRGCGKSSLVKALPWHFGPEGLRLVEVGREQLADLPVLFRRLREEPHAFVIFVDDLSFEEAGSGFKRFKAALDGSVERRPRNVAIYATTNRRHLVPERWEDRHGLMSGEVHGHDGLEEQLSLADRFVTVLFTAPDQEGYLRIVEHLARRRGLPVPPERLREEALRWERWQNARSGRSAVQFLDHLEGRLREEGWQREDERRREEGW